MLTQKFVERTKTPGYRADGEVRGLYLQVTDTLAKSWVFQYQLHGKRHEMGLGSASTFTLKKARERARDARELLADGIDPLAKKRADKAAAKLAEQRKLTFAEAAQRYFDDHGGKWSAKWREAFLDTLRRFAFPYIGSMDVKDIAKADIHRVLDPIWKTKTITADRVRNRIERVIGWAIAREHRPAGTNPAAWTDHLEHSLPAPRDLAPVKHHAAMKHADVPAFMQKLRQEPGVPARALEFTILTAARAGETRGATWDEIDFDAAAWNIPAERMKARRPHRVPLSKPVLDLLRALPREHGNKHVFLGSRPGEGLGRIGMAWCLTERLGEDATLHGFRSSFRDWAGDETSVAPDICEAALAHVRGDKTVVAYARGDLFNKRRKLMEMWARYCSTEPVQQRKRANNVVTIGGR